jgi:hypothetical protein
LSEVITLPKAKPTSINVHRIEAGEWERQNILRPVADVAKTVKYVQAGAITVVCVGVGLAGYSAYWFMKKVGGWGQDARDLFDMTIGAAPDVAESIAQGKGPQVSNPNTGPFTPLYRWVGGLFS